MRILMWACVTAWAALVVSPPRARAQSGPVAGGELSGYTCCNFHRDGNWISDANWGYFPKIAAGTPAHILEYGDNQVTVDIGGQKMTFGLDYGRQQNLREWAQRMIVPQDPRAKLADWSATAREAVDDGIVALGMTKEQVIVSLGYPPAHATPSMNAPTWKYWYDTHGTYEVVWDDAGRVKDVVAPPQIRYRVLAGSVIDAPPSASGGPVRLKDLEGLLPAPGASAK